MLEEDEMRPARRECDAKMRAKNRRYEAKVAAAAAAAADPTNDYKRGVSDAADAAFTVAIYADEAANERAKKLAQLHKRIHLPPEDLLKLSNWVDTNCQFYGSYWGRRNLRYRDLPDFRPVPTFEAAISTMPAAARFAGHLPSRLPLCESSDDKVAAG